MARKISTTIYLDPHQHEQLHKMSEETGVPMAEYIRQGVAMRVRVSSTVNAEVELLKETWAASVEPWINTNPIVRAWHHLVVRRGPSLKVDEAFPQLVKALCERMVELEKHAREAIMRAPYATRLVSKR